MWCANLHFFVVTFANAGKMSKLTWGRMIKVIEDYKLRPNKIILEKKKEPELFNSLSSFMYHAWHQSSNKLNSSPWNSEWTWLWVVMCIVLRWQVKILCEPSNKKKVLKLSSKSVWHRLECIWIKNNVKYGVQFVENCAVKSSLIYQNPQNRWR